MIEETVTMSQQDYQNLKEAQRWHQNEVQKIWDQMMERDTLIITQEEPYVKTYTIFGPDSLAVMLETPLWRIIRMKFNRKKVLAQKLKMQQTIDVRKYGEVEK